MLPSIAVFREFLLRVSVIMNGDRIGGAAMFIFMLGVPHTNTHSKINITLTLFFFFDFFISMVNYTYVKHMKPINLLVFNRESRNFSQL